MPEFHKSRQKVHQRKSVPSTEQEETSKHHSLLHDINRAQSGTQIDPPTILRLQSTLGNQAVMHLLQREQDRRGELRTGYEGERDRRRRTEPGGEDRDRGSDLDSDWAGRAILGRYLMGGGDWVITDDPDWSSYMMANYLMAVQLQPYLEELALSHAVSTPEPEVQTIPVDETIHMNMENGEGIVGYQYLHGTNANVGDFHITGTITMMTQPDSQVNMTMNLKYTWNDVIDPNPQYATDTLKSTFAELITLGFAAAYNIHITWSAQCNIMIGSDGKVIRSTGYPFGI